MIDLDPNLYITYIKCKWIKHYNQKQTGELDK